eukprot:scaffold91074_cov32-Tisochrysis_lutea.AAC.3
MGGGSFEKSRGRRAQINFDMTTSAFDEEAVPRSALAARMEVKAAKIPDRLGVNKPAWNQSVVPDNFKIFPERPLMRTLSKYDSHKRADYNFRAEVLDNEERRMYVPDSTKFHYSERHIRAAEERVNAPPTSSRVEYCVHPRLASMPRWDPSTGDCGDPYKARREREKQAQAQLDAAIRNSQRREAPAQRMGLLAGYQASLQQQRAAKLERRKLEAAGRPVTWTRDGYTPPLSETDALEMTRSVPVRKVTTWSLGSI